MFTSHSSSCEPIIFRSRTNSSPHTNISELALVDGRRDLGALSPDMMYLYGFPPRSWVYMQCNPSWRCFETLTEHSVIIQPVFKKQPETSWHYPPSHVRDNWLWEAGHKDASLAFASREIVLLSNQNPFKPSDAYSIWHIKVFNPEMGMSSLQSWFPK